MTEFEQAVADAGLQFGEDALSVLKQGWDMAVEKARDCLADKATEAWVETHGKKMSWQTCINIIAAITKMPDEERDRLLAYKD